MIRKILKINDGFSSTTPWLRSEVRRMQRGLEQAGARVTADGFFGGHTEDAVKTFQQNNGLPATGTVNGATWEALEPLLQQVDGPMLERIAQLLENFVGDLDWVHDQEGHVGNAYWPGGQSGVTLDPGVDLGFAEPDLLEELYKPLLTGEQWRAVTAVLGKRAGEARAALGDTPVLRTIQIERAEADHILPHAARPYWNSIAARFTTLKQPDTLPAVQTVLLSLAYNRGPGNGALEVLAQPLEAQDWAEVARAVANMQQDHPLAGIRKRRQWESRLIRSELA